MKGITKFWFIALKIYWLIWKAVAKRERKRGRGLPTIGSLSKCTQHPELGQAKARITGLHLGLPCGWREPSTWAINCPFPRYCSSKWDPKRSGQNSNRLFKTSPIFSSTLIFIQYFWSIFKMKEKWLLLYEILRYLLLLRCMRVFRVHERHHCAGLSLNIMSQLNSGHWGHLGSESADRRSLYLPSNPCNSFK